MDASTEPRELTAEEIRAEFLATIADMSVYWARQGGTPQEIADHVAYGILRMIDEGHGVVPAFALIPDPHPENRAFDEERGANWYPEMKLDDDAVDITGYLYYQFQQLLERLGR